MVPRVTVVPEVPVVLGFLGFLMTRSGDIRL